jgi:citrate lyase subunit beta/citryl-CoA lyase
MKRRSAGDSKAHLHGWLGGNHKVYQWGGCPGPEEAGGRSIPATPDNRRNVILRSMLYAPANHPRHAAKALAGTADAAILDLEDAVAAEQKQAARNAVRQLLRDRPAGEHPAGRPAVFVRINALGTPHAYQDLLAAVLPGVHGILLPKVESPREVATADWMLTQLERERGLEAGAVQLVPTVETASGLSHLDAIAVASPRVRRLTFGAADFALDTGMALASGDAPADAVANQALLWAKLQLVVASRAARLDAPLDTVYFELGDADGFLREAEQARRLGFQGKTCIHPSQVELANQAFSPTGEEIAQAKRTLEAFDGAIASGSAAIQLDGRMIDYPIAERARRVLELARWVDDATR